MDLALAMMQAHPSEIRHTLETLVREESIRQMGPGSTDRQQMPFEYEYDSVIGKEMWQVAESLKERGNRALKDQQYETAIKHYSDALQVAYKIQNNGEQLAKILSNRSLVHAKTKDYNAALDDAHVCFFNNLSWYKGPWRFMTALCGLNNFETAFNVGLQLLAEYKIPFDEMVCIFKDALLLLTKITDYRNIHTLRIGIDVWHIVLAQLAREKEWQTISILFQGKNNFPPVITASQIKEVAENLDLSKLLKHCSVPDWKSWGQRLAVKLLQVGAKMVSLDQDKKHGAHAAFKMCVRTGVYELLKHLFLHHIPTDDRDHVDDEGNTLLHLACRENYQTKLSAVKLLLDMKLNLLSRNKQQKTPADLLPKNDPERQAILDTMQSEGYALKDLQTSSESDDVSSSKIPADSKADTPAPALLSNTTNTSQTHTWTREQVRAWMKRNDMHRWLSRLEDIDGRQLTELKTMLETATPTFYQLLGSMGLSMAQMLTVASALRELS